MKKRLNHLLLIIIALTAAFYSCSFKKFALNQVANSLTGSGSSNVFLSDNDPELVGDALPFTIKLYETLMASLPGHGGLKVTTGSMFIMYANVYVETPASQLTDDELDKKEFMLKRAKNLYIRGRDIILKMLDDKYPGFLSLLDRKKYKAALALTTRKDLEALYWASAGWVAAFSINPFDMKFAVTLPKAEALMKRVLALDEKFRDGSVHDFFVLYYGSLPEYMGGSYGKAKNHFQKAVSLSGGKSASPYLSLATTVCVAEQDIKTFKDLLQKALDINPDDHPAYRLQNIILQRKARWLLNHLGNFFVEAEKENKENPAWK